jgi:hypothetical protein
MIRSRQAAATETVHQRYRRLLRSGFSQVEAAALLAHVAGIDRHAEDEPTCEAHWTWQEVVRLEFLRYLVDHGHISE